MFGKKLDLWLIVMALNWTLLRVNLVIEHFLIQVMPTSAASERNFSLAGQVVSARRSTFEII